MAETLRPCPFCGGEAELVRNSSGSYFVRCTDRQCAAKTRLFHENENGARASWNRRAERTCRMVDNGCELCCSECDCRHDYDDEPNYCHNCGARVVSD